MDQEREDEISQQGLDNDLKLILPGMRSKVRVAPAPLERLESYVSSPSVSDATLTSRKLREMIPCTPSPLYSYNLGFARSLEDPNGHFMPRFFPFPVSCTAQAVEQIEDPSVKDKVERQGSPESSETSADQQSGSPSVTVSPNGLMTPITTPIAENSCLGELDSSPVILALIKPALETSGNFDLDVALKSAPVNQILEHLVELCKDQLGSRFLQQLIDSEKLEAANQQELVRRIIPEARELTLDPFGNYVVQKVVDLSTAQQRSELLDRLQRGGGLFNLSIHMYGCRVVQRLIEQSTLEEQLLAARELKGHVIECVEDQNGNHVIQKLIEKLPSENLEFIVAEFLGHISVMAIHCYGCRVVQRLLEKLKPEDSRLLIAEILSNLWQLSQDQYGNYVVQHVLIHGSSHNRSVVLQVIAAHIIEFSCHKYASNIAEKALLSSDEQASRDLIIGAVIGSGGPDAPIHVLMKDRFANYVIQRCIEFSHGDQRETLVGILKAQLPTLKRVIYGKHIATAIERILH